MYALKKEARLADRGMGLTKASQPIPRSSSRLSKYSLDLDSQVVAQAELERMQRHYRILENRRKTYYEKSQFVLLKQRREIEILEKEKNELELNVELAETESSKKNSKYMKQMNQLVERRKLFLQAIDNEKMRCKQIDEQTTQVEYQIEKQKKDILWIQQSDGVESANQKKIDMLENRIAYATVQYNKLLAKNSQLRMQIDDLLKERSRFHALYRCLGKTLLRGKKEIVALIEEAKAAYDQREELETKLKVLRRRDEGDQAQHTNDIRNLRRNVEHEEKLQDFLAEKWKDRTEGRSKERGVSADNIDPMSQISEKNLAVIREVFERLKVQHQEADLDRLVEGFVQKEEQNYALFTYVHDVTQDCERLQKEIEEFRRRIGELSEMEKKRNVGYQQRLEDLQKNVKDAKKESLKSESSTKECSEIIDKLKGSILRLLALAQVPQEELDGLDVNKDSEAGLSEESALQLMTLLEKRATDIALAFAQLPPQDRQESESERDAIVSSPIQEEDKQGSEDVLGRDPLSEADVSGDIQKESVRKPSDPQLSELTNDNGEHVKRRSLGK